jgi:hypothetical protein
MPSLPNKTNRHKYTYLGILIIEVDSALGLLRRHHCCLALHAFTCRCLVLVILGKTLLPN